VITISHIAYTPGKSDVFPAYFFPGTKTSEVMTRTFKNRYGKVEIEVPKLNSSLVKEIVDNLTSSRENYLKDLSSSEILSMIYKNVELWSDPNSLYRKKAEELIPVTMGFSPQMTRRILDGMMYGFKRDLSKLNVKENDTEQIFCISPGVPGPQALTIIRGLLNKSAVFCKSSSDDAFSSLYAQSYLNIDKRVAECIAVVPWEGGKPENQEIENFVYGERGKKDAIVIFGRSGTEEIIKQKAKEAKIISFTRGISLGVIGKEMLNKGKTDEVAIDAANAICMYDQRDCFSPQLFYVEKGGEVSPLEFSEILAKKMQNLEQEIPRGELSLDASATITELMNTYQLLSLTGNLKLHEISNNGSLTGAVIFKEDQKFEPSSSYRIVRVKPINDVSEVPDLVESLSSSLHTVGVALSEERKEKLINETKKFGVKIKPISEMYMPSMLEYELFA
jgi:hypothetical protein